jgi:hypothetical protein
MFTSPRELTRRRRARRYFSALALPAAVLLFLIWGPRRYAVSDDGRLYVAVTAWGAFPYFEMSEAGAVGTGGTPVPQTRSERFIWQGIPKCLAITLILEGLLLALHRAVVAAGRLKGRCDECGYDLRGITSNRCPECGHPFDPGESKPAKDRPADAEEAVAPIVRWEGQRRRLIWTSDQRVR